MEFLILVGGFCLYIGIVIPATLVIYYKVFKRSKKSVKQILELIGY